MHPVTILLVIAALAAGVVLGALLGRRRASPRDPAETFAQPEPSVPEGVAELLAMHNSAGIVVGPHDEVLEATDAARTLGLV
ncbi:MAG TPA: two-component sensor histidine kinase, partial [Microlunatus sp.]|nr:two-component sensor histidine kinase [Microlunatus sp.]